MSGMNAWRWLESTRLLQARSFGWDWEKIKADGMYLDVLQHSISMNSTAATAEQGEFLQELGPIWKDWATMPAELDPDVRDRAVKELVDWVHFIANLAVALGVTDDEWETRYREKQDVNAERQTAEYNGVTGKCTSCLRALDDVGVIARPNGDYGDVMTVCAACGERVDG